MTQWHTASKRKPSGGRLTATRYRDKRLYEMGGDFTETKIGEENRIEVRTTGGNAKVKLRATKTANVSDPETKKVFKSEIKTVKLNPANRHFSRREIMTKGAIIELKDGREAKVTSRPGQDGVVNAVLLKKAA